MKFISKILVISLAFSQASLFAPTIGTQSASTTIPTKKTYDSVADNLKYCVYFNKGGLFTPSSSSSSSDQNAVPQYTFSCYVLDDETLGDDTELQDLLNEGFSFNRVGAPSKIFTVDEGGTLEDLASKVQAAYYPNFQDDARNLSDFCTKDGIEVEAETDSSSKTLYLNVKANDKNSKDKKINVKLSNTYNITCSPPPSSQQNIQQVAGLVGEIIGPVLGVILSIIGIVKGRSQILSVFQKLSAGIANVGSKLRGSGETLPGITNSLADAFSAAVGVVPEVLDDVTQSKVASITEVKEFIKKIAQKAEMKKFIVQLVLENDPSANKDTIEKQLATLDDATIDQAVGKMDLKDVDLIKDIMESYHELSPQTQKLVVEEISKNLSDWKNKLDQQKLAIDRRQQQATSDDNSATHSSDITEPTVPTHSTAVILQEPAQKLLSELEAKFPSMSTELKDYFDKNFTETQSPVTRESILQRIPKEVQFAHPNELISYLNFAKEQFGSKPGFNLIINDSVVKDKMKALGIQVERTLSGEPSFKIEVGTSGLHDIAPRTYEYIPERRA